MVVGHYDRLYRVLPYGYRKGIVCSDIPTQDASPFWHMIEDDAPPDLCYLLLNAEIKVMVCRTEILAVEVMTNLIARRREIP